MRVERIHVRSQSLWAEPDQSRALGGGAERYYTVCLLRRLKFWEPPSTRDAVAQPPEAPAGK